MVREDQAPHRIAAGGLIFQDQRVLLVRYPGVDGGSYLAAPGGGLLGRENIEQAITREVLEETGLHVRPRAVAMIEHLITARHKIIKIWMTCDIVSGSVTRTHGADVEGILDVGWYSRVQLRAEVVFPSILLGEDWCRLRSLDRNVVIAPTRDADF